MIIDQLTAVAASGESEMLEFKETTGARRETARTEAYNEPKLDILSLEAGPLKR